jgi:hypothetical protein
VPWNFFWLVLAVSVGLSPVAAQDSPPLNVVQEFSGSGTTTTGLFKVQDRWEVRWNARQVVSVAVMSSDGTIVAGAAGVLRGSLFVPVGGQYYLKISDGTDPSPPSVPRPPEIASPPATNTHPAPVFNTNAAPVITTNAPPTLPPSGEIDTAPPPPEAIASWHLQVVQLGSSITSDQALTVYTPFFTVPDSAITPADTPPPLPPPVLTEDESHTMVTIKGDNAQGAGFLMRSPDGVFVVTHLHLLAANPNVQLFTSSGAVITVLSLKGALDRDLALLTIQDNHYTYLPLADDKLLILPGDQLIIPDIGEQVDMLLGKGGRVVGTSAERIDFDNAMGPGSIGAPVIHVKSGTAVALVTAQKQVDVSQRLAQAWPANPAPGSEAIIPYFGLRLTGVPGFETYDMTRFLAESSILSQFHRETRCLDSYLNGRRRRAEFAGDHPPDVGPPDARLFLSDPKLRGANDTYHQLANGADENQRLEAARELLFDLQGYVDTDMANLQDTKSFYAYDQVCAQEELAYRGALKKELDELANNLTRLDNIARSH